MFEPFRLTIVELIVQIEPGPGNFVEVYHKLVDIVNPRPIAWVTTIDPEGRVNLAPFSFFNTFGSNPAIVGFAPGLRRDGTKKDTLRNVEAVGEFVVHAAVASLADAVNLSSAELPYGESEVALTGLHTRPSVHVRPPCLVEAPVALECKVLHIHHFGQGPIGSNLVLGQIVMIHLDERLLDERGRVDPRKLQTIGRMGQDFYCKTTDLFEMKRPG
jgi:flavin reductase (DIM6/NTAB) family NADH-FMN oxidoreductase RutF